MGKPQKMLSVLIRLFFFSDYSTQIMESKKPNLQKSIKICSFLLIAWPREV